MAILFVKMIKMKLINILLLTIKELSKCYKYKNMKKINHKYYNKKLFFQNL